MAPIFSIVFVTFRPKTVLIKVKAFLRGNRAFPYQKRGKEKLLWRIPGLWIYF